MTDDFIEQFDLIFRIMNSIMNQYRTSESMILTQSDHTKNRIIQLIDDIRQLREQSDTLNLIALEIEQNVNDLVNLIHEEEQKNRLYLSELSEFLDKLKKRQ